MFSTFRRAALGAASALLLTGVVAGPVAAAHQTPLIGLTVDGSLVRFTPETACDPSDPVRVSGLAAGETLLAIDERPATRGLYGLGSTSRLYLIDAMTGAATALGTAPFSPALSGSAFGFDFNPTVDRIRIVSNTGQNLRAHPDTGAVVAVDGSLRYAITDVAAGHDPTLLAPHTPTRTSTRRRARRCSTSTPSRTPWSSRRRRTTGSWARWDGQPPSSR